ncbi:MAG: AAA family ATPase [Candidatus Latescibacterota bacterium]|nr:MAG: AAA family ATPase [Candidatus Latescibacterota bacterium]
MPKRDPVYREEVPVTFPFGIHFQKSLLKLLTKDVGFANLAIARLEPHFFENEVLAWGFNFLVEYQAKYNAVPSLRVIKEETRHLDPSIRELYQLTLQAVAEADLSAEEWLRDQVIDFIKRNIFVSAFQESKALYNQGEPVKAYDLMMSEMDKLYNTSWDVTDREFFFDEFDQRRSRRLSQDVGSDVVVTGVPELDQVLGGGLSLGELGTWIAYPKRGKTTLLVNHGVQAVRRGDHTVLHAVFEGSRALVANRYDTVFAQEAYGRVKAGNLDAKTYERMQYDYRMYSQKLILRGFTEHWSYSAVDIYDEIKELKRLHDWVPDLIIVDYGDLLRGRGKGYKSETENQQAAFRDLKSLANRGFAVWTATQAQRPKKDIDADPAVLTSRNVADCYGKVRVCDFIGSINQTKDERYAKEMRLFAELYRDNEAGKIIPVRADFAKMTITTLRGVSSVSSGSTNEAVPLGYTKQEKMAY